MSFVITKDRGQAEQQQQPMLTRLLLRLRLH